MRYWIDEGRGVVWVFDAGRYFCFPGTFFFFQQFVALYLHGYRHDSHTSHSVNSKRPILFYYIFFFFFSMIYETTIDFYIHTVAFFQVVRISAGPYFYIYYNSCTCFCFCFFCFLIISFFLSFFFFFQFLTSHGLPSFSRL